MPSPLLLLSVFLAAALVPLTAEASLPRTNLAATKSAALAGAEAVDSGQFLTAGLETPFALLAGDEFAKALTCNPTPSIESLTSAEGALLEPPQLASRACEGSFSLHLEPLDFGLNPQRGPTLEIPDLRQGWFVADLKTRIGGFRLNPEDLIGRERRLSLELHWGYEVGSLGLTEDEPTDPWGLVTLSQDNVYRYLDEQQAPLPPETTAERLERCMSGECAAPIPSQESVPEVRFGRVVDKAIAPARTPFDIVCGLGDVVRQQTSGNPYDPAFIPSTLPPTSKLQERTEAKLSIALMVLGFFRGLRGAPRGGSVEPLTREGVPGPKVTESMGGETLNDFQVNRFSDPPAPQSPAVSPQLVPKISQQRQFRHLRERGEYRHGGYLESIADAQAVLDAYRAGRVTVLGKTRSGNPVVRFEGVTGTNVNNLPSGTVVQPTNVFMIKGTTSPSVVPMSPVWKP